MASLNKVFLMGNLTRDPEVRYTPKGTAVCDLGMAVNRKFKGGDGQEQEEVCYVRVVVWDKQAVSCGEYLRKGSQVLVEGRLKYEEWEKDGKKNNRLNVVAERVQFMGKPKAGEATDSHAFEETKPAVNNGSPEKNTAGSGSVDEDNLPF